MSSKLLTIMTIYFIYFIFIHLIKIGKNEKIEIHNYYYIILFFQENHKFEPIILK